MANTKITSNVIADNAVGITQLNVSDGSDGQALVTNGSGTLSFATVGVSGISSSADATAITIDSSENVGIGNTSPGRNLSINATSPTLQLCNSNTGTSAANGFELAVAGDTAYIIQREDANLQIHTNDTLRMLIDSNGQVMIGHSSSFAHSDADNLAIGDGTNNSGLTIYTGSSKESSIIFGNAGTNGNIEAGIKYYHESHGTVANRRAMTFATGGSMAERMRIGSNGKIGVATTSTDHQLTVNGSAFDGIQLQSGGSDCGYLGVNTDTVYVGAGSNLIFHTGNAGLTNGTERMRIHASGCVGVGSTSDRSLGTNIGTLVVNGSAGGGLWLSPGDSSAMTSKIYAEANGSVGDLIINNGTGVGSGGIRIQTNSTERWRIDSAGRMTNAFDALNSSILQVAGNSIAGGVVNFIDPDVSVATSNHILRCTFSVDTDSQGKFIAFYDGGGNIGSVSQNGAAAVSFNTTSDERLKENIVDVSSQLNTIKNIKVREFDWKSSSKHDVGMIAQELKDVIPGVVTQGGEDVTEDPWGVDYGKLTPYLIKAIQEQQVIIDDLKSRIETLEG
jgi:hypothetical protein